MEALRSRVNPRSAGDLGLWTFVALFFMILSGGVAQEFLPAAQSDVQLFRTLAFILPGLLFLVLRKLISRAMKAESEAGSPGRVTIAHAIAMSLLGGVSILVVIENAGALLLWMVASKFRDGPQQGLTLVQVMAVEFVALFLCGLWAGWRVGLAGWAFSIASLALYLFISVLVSITLPGLPDASGVAIISANFAVAAAGGYVGSSLYRRKLLARTRAADPGDGGEDAR